jgi:hypothetical protein
MRLQLQTTLNGGVCALSMSSHRGIFFMHEEPNPDAVALDGESDND